MELANEILFPEVAALLEEGHTVTLKAKGTSMMPFIVGGRDSVVLQKADRVAVGDIVLARLDDGRHVLHRVTGLAEGGKVVNLMGDGSIRCRETCRRSDLLGKAVQIVRNGRTVDCSAAGERRWARLWQALLPVRRYVLWIFRKICM